MYTFHSQREAAAAWAESGLFNKGSAETHIRRFLRLAANPGGGGVTLRSKLPQNDRAAIQTGDIAEGCCPAVQT